MRIVLVVAPQRRAFSAQCGTRWIQDGGVQRGVERPGSTGAEASPAAARPA